MRNEFSTVYQARDSQDSELNTFLAIDSLFGSYDDDDDENTAGVEDEHLGVKSTESAVAAAA